MLNRALAFGGCRSLGCLGRLSGFGGLSGLGGLSRFGGLSGCGRLNRFAQFSIGCQSGGFPDGIQGLPGFFHHGIASQSAQRLLGRFQRERSVEAHLVLGTAYLGLADMARARKTMEQALTLDPKVAEVHYNLARILLAADPPDTTASRRHYQQALELGGKPDADLEAILGGP